MRAPAAVLMSGGPDSLITLRWAERHPSITEIIPLYFDVGNRYAESEWEALQKISERTKETIHGDSVLRSLGQWEEEDAHIFARNAFLALAATKKLPNGGWLLLTVQADELNIPDRSVVFMEHLGPLLTSLVKGPVLVTSPWLHTDKTGMVEWYLKHGYSTEDLLDTTSCYERYPGLLQCGDCAACVRRFIAFSLNGLEEEYVVDPLKSETGKMYVDRALEGTYSPVRNHRIRSAFGVE